MKNQSILRLWTTAPELRDNVHSWDGESGDLINPDKDIGLSSDLRIKLYKTPCHALADGWRLIGPPQAGKETMWIWWFEK